MYSKSALPADEGQISSFGWEKQLGFLNTPSASYTITLLPFNKRCNVSIYTTTSIRRSAPTFSNIYYRHPPLDSNFLYPKVPQPNLHLSKSQLLCPPSGNSQ